MQGIANTSVLLHDSRYLTMRLVDDGALAILYARRTTEPFPSIDVTTAELTAVLNAVARVVDRSRAGVLYDLRAVSGRNEESFDRLFFARRDEFYGGFHRVALLVRSSVGRMQVERLFTSPTLRVRALLDEEGARGYLYEETDTW
ncbi:MAG: hypothetical protein KC468_32530 [Myxococcales bacterium]|nr:hypothetical protein [Myxococcales bacterium]